MIKKIWELDYKYRIFWWASLISFISVFFADEKDIVYYWVITMVLITIASIFELYRNLAEMEKAIKEVIEEIHKRDKESR